MVIIFLAQINKRNAQKHARIRVNILKNKGKTRGTLIAFIKLLYLFRGIA
jgi:hypothetical protein